MRKEQYFDGSHLTDAGISLCVDALHLDRMSLLPDGLMAHLQSCAVCRNEVMDIYSATSGTDYRALGAHPLLGERHAKGRILALSRWMPLAAAAAVIGFVLIWSLRPQATLPGSPAVAGNTVQTVPDTQGSYPASQPEQRVAPPGKGKSLVDRPSEELYAANFEPNETMESLTGLVVRSSGFEVVAPAGGAVFAPGVPVIFRWRGAPQGNLTLTIWDNREKRVFVAETTASTLTYSDPIAPGLYYWQLETEADLLYTGKFAVRTQ